MLEAECDQAADNERCQVFVKNQCRRYDLREDIHRVKDNWICYQRQVHEIFDLPTSEQCPYSFVFAHDVVAGRMVRPHSAVAAEPVQEHVDSEVTPIQSGVEGELQTRHHTRIVAAVRTLGQHQEPILGRDQVRGQQLALGHQILDREDELVVTLPGSSVRRALPALRYLSAESYAVEVFARRPAIRFSSATRSRSSTEAMRCEPRLS